jgi:hypothetical protein
MTHECSDGMAEWFARIANGVAELLASFLIGYLAAKQPGTDGLR